MNATDGYFTTDTHTYSSPTRALTTESLDVDTDAPDWLFSTDTFGHVRIDPRSTDSAQPVFVGIAPTRDVNAYLDQVQHDEITDLDVDPFTIDRSRHAGEARPAMPAAQTFWTASSVDGRPLDWKVRSGEWSVVMMNADASPGVSVDASIGADAPFIRDLALVAADPGLRARPDRARPRRVRRPRPLALRHAAAAARRGARVRLVGPSEGPARAGPSVVVQAPMPRGRTVRAA